MHSIEHVPVVLYVVVLVGYTNLRKKIFISEVPIVIYSPFSVDINVIVVYWFPFL